MSCENGCGESKNKQTKHYFNVILVHQYLRCCAFCYYYLIVLVSTFLVLIFSEHHQSWHLLWMLSGGIYFSMRELSPIGKSSRHLLYCQSKDGFSRYLIWFANCRRQYRWRRVGGELGLEMILNSLMSSVRTEAFEIFRTILWHCLPQLLVQEKNEMKSISVQRSSLC